MRDVRVAVDIGGTFTDCVLTTPTASFTSKVLTTYPDPSDGFMTGLRQVLARGGLAPGDVGFIIHGTTLATNALIERKGARTAFLTTGGFADVLEIGTEARFALYDMMIQKPAPLVPAALRFEAAERVSAAGEVILPLDEAAVHAVVEQLRREKIESLAIGFLHAYANSTHEFRAREILQQALPDLYITCASDVCREIREYERFSTACVNAYIRPLMARYLAELERRLQEAGFACPLLIVTSGGGMTTCEIARQHPVRLIESGPAGGVVLAATIGQTFGLDRVMSFDMGGTTAKICFIDDGEPTQARTFEAARAYRFTKGSGIPLRIPVIEMVEIGAGGGSIARVDHLRKIQVGPESANSTPGPACYGRGGTRATVTDANLIGGRIDPARFANGSITLDAGASRSALLADIGGPLGFGEDEAAAAVAEIVEENMASAARGHAAETGRNIGEYAIVAFGGGAPLHAASIAEKVGARQVIVPADAGVGSARGFLQAPVSFESVQTWVQPTATLDLAEANRRLDAMSAEAGTVVRQIIGTAPFEVRRALMRYRGQGHEIEVTLPPGRLEAGDIEKLEAAFIDAYTRIYHRSIPGLRTELTTLLVTARSAPVVPGRAALPNGEAVLMEAARERTLMNARTGRREPLGIVERSDFPAGRYVAGPKAISEDDTTTLVPQGWQATKAATGDLILTRIEA